MNLRRTVLAGVSLSVASIVLYVIILGIKPSDIASVGYRAFIAASLLALLKLLVQGVRFHIIARQLHASHPIPAHRSILMRISSEFVSMVTPAYIGGETLRVAWLTKNGIQGGQAIWAVYLEILNDVVAGTIIAIIAGIYAVQKGVYLTGALVLVISGGILFFYILVTILSIKKLIRVPSFLMPLARRAVGAKRVKMLEELIETTSASYDEAASNLLGYSSLKAVLLVSILTILIVVLAGFVFWVIASASGLQVDPFLSILSVYVSITIGSLPITIGGSGLSEIGISLFASSVLGSVAWASILVWRIASYHVPLAFSSIVLIATTYRETRNDTTQHSTPSKAELYENLRELEP